MYRQVAVLKGGFSQEREVSLRSGAAVARGLRASGCKVEEIDITAPDFTLPPETEAVFIVLHGVFGEDGAVQEILERRRIPYTGSGPSASRLAFDKLAAKKKLIQNGIMTPVFEVARNGCRRAMPLPLVVKPVRQGSSFGVTRVEEETQWTAALHEALKYDDTALVEEFIPGRELTVGIVGDEVLPVIEIIAPNSNYDYYAKYTAGVTRYLAPAPLPEETTRLCQAMAWRTFQALGGIGFGRVDLRLRPDGRVYVLELNTIPGFTETSLLPKAAAAAGIDFPELCARILRLARCGNT